MADEFVFPAHPGSEGSVDLNSWAFWHEFFSEIDWSEPWIIGLLCVHVITLAVIFVSQGHETFQVTFGSLLVAAAMCAENLNEYAALNWQSFARQQYFDSYGFFVTVMYSVPILINLVILVALWLYQASTLLISLKRRQLGITKSSKPKSKTEKDPSDPEASITAAPIANSNTPAAARLRRKPAQD